MGCGCPTSCRQRHSCRRGLGCWTFDWSMGPQQACSIIYRIKFLEIYCAYNWLICIHGYVGTSNAANRVRLDMTNTLASKGVCNDACDHA